METKQLQEIKKRRQKGGGCGYKGRACPVVMVMGWAGVLYIDCINFLAVILYCSFPRCWWKLSKHYIISLYHSAVFLFLFLTDSDLFFEVWSTYSEMHASCLLSSVVSFSDCLHLGKHTQSRYRPKNSFMSFLVKCCCRSAHQNEFNTVVVFIITGLL